MKPVPGCLYNIAINIPYFYTGRSSNGTQTLMGVQMPDLVMVVFDADGNYLRTDLKAIPQDREPDDREPVNAPQVETDVDSAENEFSAYINEWQTDLGVVPGTISVKQFYLPERFIGITDLPEHYQEVLDHPENFTEERLQMLRRDIEAWRTNGQFVLDWDEDYYMSEEGDLDST